MRKGPGSINRVYRLVWSDAAQTYVAVAELTKARGKRSSGVVGSVLMSAVLAASGAAYAADPPAANALPTGGAVAAGIAAIGQSGNHMNITQGSERAIINWNTFNIGSAASVNFQQPGASSVMLNRVMSADPSAIYGRMSANGQVMLINPNGIVFGAGSSVDVGGLVASTLNLSNADFLAGRLNFARDGATGSVLNKGSLTAADNGYIAMLAPEVRNQGVVVARMGTVALAAGDAVTLDMSGNGLLNVRVTPGTINTLIENREMVRADGGQVIMSAGAASRLLQQAVAGGQDATQLVTENGVTRLVLAGGDIQAAGGRVNVEGRVVNTHGAIDVSGAQGGAVNISGDFVAQSGTVRADSTAASGGQINVSGSAVIQTASTKLSADGAAGGGSVVVTGGVNSTNAGTTSAADNGGTVYTSGTLSAQGTGANAIGGSIDVTATSVQLRAAQLDASGQGDGGNIRIGGGFRGQDASIANAQTVGINGSTTIRADAGTTGHGGTVSVWADDSTTYGGLISARGGSTSGDGGRAEVSGKQTLQFVGQVDLSATNGRAGQLELDPHNIIIDDVDATLAALSLDDPNASASRNNSFAANVLTLDNGNVVISAPTTTVGGVSKVGAVYLYNSRNGSLLNQLYGGSENDMVGSHGVQKIAGDNYLVFSPYWGRTTTPVSFIGNDSFSGSLKRFTTSDATAGAITWQNGSPAGSTGASGSGGSPASRTVSTGTANIVGTTNSLVGDAANFDRVGETSGSTRVSVTGQTNLVSLFSTTAVTTLTDGNIVFAIPNWNNGRGAVTWMNAATGELADGSSGGLVSAANSLVGSTGYRETALRISAGGQQFYVTSFSNAGPTLIARFTASNPSTNNFATESVDPLSIGFGDNVGRNIRSLANGNFVVLSPNWTNTTTSADYAGAVTWGGPGNRTGVVSASNSLVGNTAFNAIGSNDIALVGARASQSSPRENYIVSSPYWGGGNGFFSTDFKGAMTWVDGSTGRANSEAGPGAVVSATNSLIGAAGEMVGTIAGNGGSFVYSTRAIGSGNGTQFVQDSLGNLRLNANSPGVSVLDNGHALNITSLWGSGKGAYTVIPSTGTWVGGAPVVGQVSATNSLVGALAGDVGSASTSLLLSTDRLVLNSAAFGGGNGAVSVVDSTDGQIIGEASGTRGAVISSGNSLVGGTTFDQVGRGGVRGVGTKASDGRYSDFIVLSPRWGSTDATSVNAKGAVTWGSGTTGVQGAVSSSNSLVGNAGDYVGSLVSELGRTGVGGGVNDGLSTISQSLTAGFSGLVTVLSSGNYIVSSPQWSGSRGAVTWASGTSGARGVVSAANSLTGTTDRLVTTNTVTQTHADGRSYLDTTYTEVRVGDFVGISGTALADGAYLVSSPFWNEGRGALTWISPTGQFSTQAGGGSAIGAVSQVNSLVGATAANYTTTQLSGTEGGDGSLAGGASLLPIFAMTHGDSLGVSLENTSYFKLVESVLASDTTRGTSIRRPLMPYATVFKSASNNSNNKLAGYYYFAPSGFSVSVANVGTSGDFVVGSPGWDNGSTFDAGAVTFGSASNGLPVGTMDSTNSLVSNNTLDRYGRSLFNGGGFAGGTGILTFGNGNFLVTSPGWDNGSTTTFDPNAGRGAITFVDLADATAHGLGGTVSDTNSLVGATRGDRAGQGSSTLLADGNRVVLSNGFANGTATFAGAVTWLSQTSALTGTLGVANSLVGQASNDSVGSFGITARPDGSYLVNSPNWSNGSAARAGAVTYGQAGTALTGFISAANSLVGTQSNDFVGGSGITLLPNGAFVVLSPNWTNGSASAAGAATYVPAGQTLTGPVSANNSLVGTTSNDRVGGSLLLVQSGTAGVYNYLVSSTSWSDPDTRQSFAGAVTWVDGASGYVYGQSSGPRGATINPTNSLIGNRTFSFFGNLQSLDATIINGQFVAKDAVVTSTMRVGDRSGTLTLIPGATGIAGYIDSRNSLIGFNDTAADGVNSNVSYSLLPYATTSLERVGKRLLAWTSTQSPVFGLSSVGISADNPRAFVLTVINEQSGAINGALGRDSASVAAGDGSDWRSGVSYIASQAELDTYGLAGGVLPFTAGGNGSDAIIAPSVINAILSAGTDLTLQANNNIMVYKAITANNTGGNGGTLTLQAGRSVRIHAPVSTDNGNLVIRANESVANGVVAADADSSEGSRADIIIGSGGSINAGTGSVSMTLAASSDKTKTVSTATRSGTGPFSYTFGTRSVDSNSSGDILLGSIEAANILAVNEGGSNALSNGGNIRGNQDTALSFLKTGSADGRLLLSAARNVLLGSSSSGQTVTIENASGAAGAFNVVMGGDRAGTGSGAIALANARIVSNNGRILLAGGTVDANGDPTGFADADSSATPGNTFTAQNGVHVGGSSLLNAGTGNVTLRGKSQSASGAGVNLQGVDANNPIEVSGAEIVLDGRGTSTAGVSMTNVRVGDASNTTRVALLSDGFANSSTGGVAVGTDVAFTGNGSAALEIASSDSASAAQIGGASNSGSGFWVSDAQLATVFANQSGFTGVSLGSADSSGQTTVKSLDLVTTFSSTPLAADFKVQGGSGGLTLDGNITNGLAADKVLTLATSNGGALNLGTGSVASTNVKLSASGSGASISQTGSGGIAASSVLLDATDATVAIDGTANAITTLAGTIASGSITNAQTLTIGNTQGANGLTSNGNVTVEAHGATADLQLDAPLVSNNGNVVAVAGRHFLNTVAGDQGLQAANGQYLVYSAEPTSLPMSTDSARGMSGGFNKHYAENFTGTTPTYATSGNWFFYANTPTITVTPGSGTVVYGESGINAVNITGLIDGDTEQSALSGNPVTTGGSFTATASGNRPAGTYNVSLTGLGTLQSPLGYTINLSSGAGTLTVTPRPVNVNADVQTKVYGENDPSLGFTTEAQSAGRGLVTGDALTGALARAAGETVAGGPYAISQGTVANNNYTINFTGNTLSITPRPVNVNADARSKIYGDNDPTLTFTAEAASAGRGLKTGDTFTGALTRASGETVAGGPYAISLGSLANGNYTINFTGNGFTINQRPVELVVNNANKVYGEADPALTFTPEVASTGRGLKFGDTFTGELTRVAGETVAGGPYTISQGTIANNNYAITVVDGALIILPRPVDVTAAAKTKVYGDADPELTFTVEGASPGRGLLGGESLSGAISRAAGETVGAGPYAISQGTLDNSNYAINFTNGVFTITRAPLTVTADDKERRFGEADSALTFTVNSSQLKRGDAESVVGNVVLRAPSGAGLLPDSYPITIASASADNYALTLVDGVLTVTPVPMVRSENLVVQQVPQTSTSTSVAPSMQAPVVETASSAAAVQPGMLAMRDGGLSAPAASSTALAAAPAASGSATPASSTSTASSAPAGSAPTSLGLAPAVRTQAAPGAFQVAVVSKPAGAADAVVVNAAIGDARVNTGTAVKVEIPQTAFAATRADAKVTLSAQSADGAALPSWLSFNAQTGTVEGTPPAGFKGDVVVKVVARDERGNEAVQTLKITVAAQ